MELYKDVSYDISRLITERYSTSFSMSTQLFDSSIRLHIYAIYGLVRIADEIVDTYRGAEAKVILRKLEQDVYAATERGYDTNPIIHSFALTAKEYSIGSELLRPFFQSMEMDLQAQIYTVELYNTYIYGSAEVIGLMCLRVFCNNDDVRYEELKPGARSLGAAYQKINFLRDITADYKELGRLYFPGVQYENFNESQKTVIIADIEANINHAREYVDALPSNSRRAVKLSLEYYGELLYKIERTPAEVLKIQRIRVSRVRKIVLYARIKAGSVR